MEDAELKIQCESGLLHVPPKLADNKKSHRELDVIEHKIQCGAGILPVPPRSTNFKISHPELDETEQRIQCESGFFPLESNNSKIFSFRRGGPFVSPFPDHIHNMYVHKQFSERDEKIGQCIKRIFF